MRPIVLILALLTTRLAVAQQLIAPQELAPPSGWRYQVVDAPPIAKRNDGLIIAGALMLTVGYAANLQAGIPTGEWFLDVPLVGPLMETARMSTSGNGSLGDWIDFVLVGDALVQMGGLALTIAGATTWQHKPGVQRLELVPTLAGAALRGTF